MDIQSGSGRNSSFTDSNSLNSSLQNEEKSGSSRRYKHGDAMS